MRASRSPFTAFLGVLLPAVAIVALRAPFLDTDFLKSDEAIYAVGARAWQHGLLPGRDVWDNKPPGMPAIYALSSYFPGGMILGSRMAALLLSVVTLLATLRLARLVAPRLAWWPVGMAYVLGTHATGWLPGEWVPLNGEIPATGFVTLCAVLLAEWWHRQRLGADAADGKRSEGLSGLSYVLGAGIVGGLSVYFRQTAALPVAALALWVLWAGGRAGGGKGALGAAAVMAAGGVVALAPMLGYYCAQGAASDLWQVWVARGMAYASQEAPLQEGIGNAIESLTSGPLPFLVSLSLLGAACACREWVYLSREGCRMRTGMLALVVVWGLASTAALLPGGHLFTHYFIQIGPVLGLAAGLALARFSRPETATPLRAASWLALVMGLALAVQAIHASGPLRSLDGAPRPINRERYMEVAQEIRSRTSPADRIVVWAWAPQVYWYADRLPACRDVTLNYALGWIGGGPMELLEGARSAVIEDLQRVCPPVIVVANDAALPFSDSPAWRPEAAPEIWSVLRRDYRLSGQIRHWDIYERR